MKLSAEHIMARVQRVEDQRAQYKRNVDLYRSMWKLDAGFGRSLDEAVKAGQEQIVLPTPYNTINLALRLVSSKPLVSVEPGEDDDEDSVIAQEKRQKFLAAMWQQVNYQQRRNVVADQWMYAFVDGRFAWEVKWVEDVLPKMWKKKYLPFSVRPLNPLNVGVESGPLYTRSVYHKRETTLIDAYQLYNKVKKRNPDHEISHKLQELFDNDGQNEDICVEITDFWYVDETDGTIWNAILCDGEELKPAEQTDYPGLPIITGRGDYAPGMGDDYDGLSLLHPLMGLWQYQCRLASQMATGLLWHFWPAITVQNENGDPVDDIQIGPGMTTPVPPGTKVDFLRIDPNVPLSQAVYGQIEAATQQSAFPEVMFGKAPGDLQAGYGVSLLSDAAKGRIKNYVESMELTLSHVNSLVLALIEKKAGKKGVSIWQRDERDNTEYVVSLSKEHIRGNYGNTVDLTPHLPQDEMQKQTLGLRLVEGGVLSRQTYREKFLHQDVPSDEAARVALEELIQSDEMRAYRLQQAAIKHFKPLQNALKVLDQAGMLPAGWHKMPDGTIMSDKEMESQGQQMGGMMPPDMGMMPPDMAAMGGMPPGMGGPPPPMGEPGMMPGMMPPGMPPGMPPVGGPPMGPPPMSPAGPPPPVGMGPGGPLQPEAINGPMGGGIPPELQGQITPEMLEMIRQQDPLTFQQLVNGGMPPQEELNVLAGLPPGGFNG